MRMIFVLLGLSAFFITPAMAQQKTPTVQEIKASTEKLEKDWDAAKREYKKKFKSQMAPIEDKIKESKIALDNGDINRRNAINDDMRQMKILRDDVREDFHEITVTSLVDLSSLQKHFKNAKDDTKD